MNMPLMPVQYTLCIICFLFVVAWPFYGFLVSFWQKQHWNFPDTWPPLSLKLPQHAKPSHALMSQPWRLNSLCPLLGNKTSSPSSTCPLYPLPPSPKVLTWWSTNSSRALRWALTWWPSSYVTLTQSEIQQKLAPM